MSKTFNVAVKTLFCSGMAEFTSFRQVKLPKDLAQPGEVAFGMEGGDRSAWICLGTSARGYNEFSVNFGWSLAGGFPGGWERRVLGHFEGHETLRSHPQGFVSLRGPNFSHWQLGDNDSDNVIAKSWAMLASPDAQEAHQLAAPLVGEAIDAVRARGLAYANAVFSFTP